jgi:hypothetical protein
VPMHHREHRAFEVSVGVMFDHDVRRARMAEAIPARGRRAGG